MKILMDAGPWLAVPPRGYGGLENVVATLTTELRSRGHEIVLATVGESELPADGRVTPFATEQFHRLAAPYPEVTGIAHAHEHAVVDEIRRHAADGVPFTLVHSHLEVVGPAMLSGLAAAPPILHTLHWDVRRNADFYATFDGRGRVFYAGVSQAQTAQAPAALRRQLLGAVPLAVPIPQDAPLDRDQRDDYVLVLSRICELKGTDVALRACRAAGVPLVVAGPVGGLPDRPALDAALADPASPVRDYPDVRWFLDHVAPLLDDRRSRWIGSVSGSAKADLLRRARAVLFPIRWPEPGGTAVCEALAAGTPVVGMAQGCLPSLIEDGVTGFLVESEPELAAALGGLGGLDPAACADAARRRFSPGIMADGYERLYAEVLRRSGARPGRRRWEVEATPAR